MDFHYCSVKNDDQHYEGAVSGMSVPWSSSRNICAMEACGL